MKKVLRILLPIIFLVVAATYLNSAAYSAWVSGGPPNEHPDAWAYRSFKHFFYGIGFVIFAATIFISLKPSIKGRKLRWGVGLFLMLFMFATPHFKKHLEIDSCLDQGEKWNEAYHRCEK